MKTKHAYLYRWHRNSIAAIQTAVSLLVVLVDAKAVALRLIFYGRVVASQYDSCLLQT